jgi:hypothetical protein
LLILAIVIFDIFATPRALRDVEFTGSVTVSSRDGERIH